MNPLGDSVPTPATHSKRKRMVVGFVFSYPATCVDEKVERGVGDPVVLLVKKSEPLWQRGKWNGPGGANFFDEGNKVAMSRELREETGLEIDADEWEVVAFMRGSDFEVCVLAASLPLGALHLTPLDEAEAAKSGREYHRWHDINKLPPDVIPDVRWLVPLALDGRFYPVHCDVKPICERKNVEAAPAVIGGRETDEPAGREPVMTVHVLPAGGSDGIRRVCELIESVEGLTVNYAGSVFVTAAGSVATFEKLFGTRISIADGSRVWNPKLPASWREIVTNVSLPPEVEFCV